jgi:plastocyanin
MSRHFVGSILAAGLVFLVPAISRATIHTVNMSGTSFSPTGTIVHFGDTVRWVDVSLSHTTTSDASSPKSWTSGTMAVGQHFDVVFKSTDGPGPFPYHCIFHVSFGMVDTIHVAVASCCTAPTTGDVDASGAIDISDLQAMVDFLFSSIPFPSTCFKEQDVDKSGTVDISDLQALIDYLFNSVPLPSCV